MHVCVFTVSSLNHKFEKRHASKNSRSFSLSTSVGVGARSWSYEDQPWPPSCVGAKNTKNYMAVCQNLVPLVNIKIMIIMVNNDNTGDNNGYIPGWWLTNHLEKYYSSQWEG